MKLPPPLPSKPQPLFDQKPLPPPAEILAEGARPPEHEVTRRWHLAFKHATFVQWEETLRSYATEEERLSFIKDTLRHKVNLHIFGRSPETGAAIFPRGFAKSTWEKIDTLHDIVYALEPVILYISAVVEDAQFHFESMKGELESNDLLRTVYGNLVPQISKPGTKWNNRHFETLNGVNLVARGAGKGRGVNIRNQRPTKVVVDDGETDEMVRSDMRREKFWRWLVEVIIPSLDAVRGKLKMVGTVIHPKCAVKRFHEERGGIFLAAIENGQSIWPEQWSLEKLYRLRDGYTREDGKRILGIGTRAFQQEYQNSPVGDGLTIFQQSWLDRYTWETLPPLDDLEIVMAVDPAAGESSIADDYGACVIGRHKVNGKRYVLASGKYHGGITGAMQWFHDIYVTWEPDRVGIEAARTVQAFYQLIRDTGKYRLIKLLPSLGIGAKPASKEERAKLVEPHVEQGMVLFHPKQVDLYDQAVAFPSADVHDDVLDAFMHCNSMLDVGSDTMTATTGNDTRPGTANIRKRLF